jgi:hypothetical protein
MKTQIEALISKLREKAEKENRNDLRLLATWYSKRVQEETEPSKLYALKLSIQKQL